jgi:hypothetical protein
MRQSAKLMGVQPHCGCRRLSRESRPGVVGTGLGWSGYGGYGPGYGSGLGDLFGDMLGDGWGDFNMNMSGGGRVATDVVAAMAAATVTGYGYPRLWLWLSRLRRTAIRAPYGAPSSYRREVNHTRHALCRAREGRPFLRPGEAKCECAAPDDDVGDGAV